MSMTAKVAVVTGASSGIGAAIASKLGGAGMSVVLAARRGDELRRVAKSMAGKSLVVETDVRDRKAVERLRNETIRAFGQVDVWINNAGRGISRSVLDLTDADFDEMMAVNVKSALYGAQAIVPHFIERGQGHLINISSFLGRVPIATHRSAYNAAKAALNALTANLRADLRATHPAIHVSLVMPGLVATAFAKNALYSQSAVAPQWGAAETQTPEDIAAVVAELIEHPVAERYTSPSSSGLARRYFEDVSAFEGPRPR